VAGKGRHEKSRGRRRFGYRRGMPLGDPRSDDVPKAIRECRETGTSIFLEH
jgi:hypothetical protein